jgi:hypothetical protein
MAKEIMRRKAADNKYLHRDFHGALSVGLMYLQRHYGPDAVREYLRQFAISFYAPLTEAIRQRGLAAARDHFEHVYAEEGGQATFSLTDDELIIDVAACPAVTHMRANGYPVSEMFDETTRTVNRAICEGTPFDAELLDYDPQTGRGRQRFFRREP